MWTNQNASRIHCASLTRNTKPHETMTTATLRIKFESKDFRFTKSGKLQFRNAGKTYVFSEAQVKYMLNEAFANSNCASVFLNA